MHQNRFTLPRDVDTGEVAVPTSAGVVAAVNAEIGNITLTNTTAATITFTLTDNQSSPVTILNAINVDPNSPVILEWTPALLCTGGIQWKASATGLNGRLLGRRETGWVQQNGYATSTSSNA